MFILDQSRSRVRRDEELRPPTSWPLADAPPGPPAVEPECTERSLLPHSPGCGSLPALQKTFLTTDKESPSPGGIVHHGDGERTRSILREYLYAS